VKVCPNCGKDVMEDYDSCFHCGAELQLNSETYVVDHGDHLREVGLVFLLIAFFFPFFGLIVAMMIKRNHPLLARNMFLVITVSVVFYAVMTAIIGFFIAV